MYSRQKCVLIFIFALRYPIDKSSQEFGKLYSHISRDRDLCAKCFKDSFKVCQDLDTYYEFDEDVLEGLNSLFGVRQIRVLKNNKDRRILAKYLANGYYFERTLENEEKNNYAYLSAIFFEENRLEGMQLCPQNGVQRFVDFFAQNYSQLNVWVHMNVDIQPILIPYLHSMGFPVPDIYTTCGFTIFQSYEGTSLANLSLLDVKIKLQIAIQLLEGVMQFSEGFDQFRIYITDMSMDNVVYNPESERVYFVDLDTVLVVDSKPNKQLKHRHQYIECDNCFAFSPADICASSQSDINIFSACQILRQDLKGNLENGFLNSILKEYSEIEVLLNECVDCPEESCRDRFNVAKRLISRLKKTFEAMS